MANDIDWDSKDINVIYDVFYDQGTRLGGVYTSLGYRAEDAGDEESSRFWTEQAIALRRERMDVGPDDRAAMVEYIKRWGRMVDQLTAVQRQIAA